MWKQKWGFLSGDLVVTVTAFNDEDEKVTFTFEAYSEHLLGYDQLKALEDAACAFAKLRDLWGIELTEIEEKKQ